MSAPLNEPPARASASPSTAGAVLSVPVGVVLGCPRSGTTFLMRALNALPGTACLTGIAYPVVLPQVLAHPLPDDVREALVSAFPVAIERYLQSGLFNARAPALQKWWAERAGPGGLAEALRGRRATERLVYKEPFLSFAPGLVLASIPAAPVVYLVRDGRDCANSLVRSYDVLSDERLTRLWYPEMRMGRRVDHRYVPWWVAEGDEDAFLAATPYVRAVWMWKAMAERCEAAFGTPEAASPEAAGRVLTLHYEALMAEPQAHGARVAAHLGATPSRAYRRRLEDARTTSIGSFRRRDPAEVAAAERVAGDALARLGYR